MNRLRSSAFIAIVCLVISAPALAQVGSLWNDGDLGALKVVADFSADPGLEAITTTITNEVVIISLGSGAELGELPPPFNAGIAFTTYVARDFNGDGRAEILCINQGAGNATRLVGLLELDSRNEILRVWPDAEINSSVDYAGDIRLSAAEPNALVMAGNNLVLFSPESGTILYDAFADPGISHGMVLESFIIDDFNGDGNEEILVTLSQGGLPPYLTTLIGDTGVSSARDFESTFGIMMGPGQPNPAAGPNSISYELPKGSHVSINIYDAAGRHIRTVVDSQRTAGAHRAFWDGRDSQGRSVSSGIYFYELKAEGQRLTQKVLQVR